MNINPIISYDVALFHFIDHLSKWDFYVEDKIYEYFKEHFRLSKLDQEKLKEYRNIRKTLTWEDECSLFHWAHHAFPQHTKYTKMYPVIEYFEKRQNHKHVSLEIIIKDKLQALTVKLNKIYKELSKKEQHINLVFRKTSKLFNNTTYYNSNVTMYAFPKFGSGFMGGANGNCIYIEMSPSIHLRHEVQMLVHEYFHKAIHPDTYFRHHLNIRDETLYLNNMDNAITTGTYFAFCNEGVTHTLIDVLLFHENPTNVIASYNDNHDGLETLKFQRRKSIWESVKILKPILEKYLNDKITISETQNALDIVLYDFYMQNK